MEKPQKIYPTVTDFERQTGFGSMYLTQIGTKTKKTGALFAG
jgi:hypothetical protein